MKDLWFKLEFVNRKFSFFFSFFLFKIHNVKVIKVLKFLGRYTLYIFFCSMYQCRLVQ